MAGRPVEPPSQVSDHVTVAKITAVQAVVVAVIAGLAGILSTAGVSYLQRSQALADKDREMAALGARSDAQLTALKQQLEGTRAVSALISGPTLLDQRACYERAVASVRAAMPKVRFFAASLREVSDAGSKVEGDGLVARLVCDPVRRTAVVAVAGLHDKALADDLALKILASLAAPER
jgi:hypothetical protein